MKVVIVWTPYEEEGELNPNVGFNYGEDQHILSEQFLEEAPNGWWPGGYVLQKTLFEAGSGLRPDQIEWLLRNKRIKNFRYV